MDDFAVILLVINIVLVLATNLIFAAIKYGFPCRPLPKPDEPEIINDARHIPEEFRRSFRLSREAFITPPVPYHLDSIQVIPEELGIWRVDYRFRQGNPLWELMDTLSTLKARTRLKHVVLLSEYGQGNLLQEREGRLHEIGCWSKLDELSTAMQMVLKDVPDDIGSVPETDNSEQFVASEKLVEDVADCRLL